MTACFTHSAPWLSLVPSLHKAVSCIIDVAQLNARAAESQNYLHITAVPAANHPWDSRKSPHIGSLSRKTKGKGLIVHFDHGRKACLSQWSCNGWRPASRVRIKRIFVDPMWLIWSLRDQEGRFLWGMQDKSGSNCLLGSCSKEQWRGTKAINFLKNCKSK